MKKREDYQVVIKADLKDLKNINVGNSYVIDSVNRTTGEVIINRYSLDEWNDPNKLMIAEDLLVIK